LKSGDFVSALLDYYDDDRGWIAFVVAKNSPTYSLRDGGWRQEQKYERNLELLAFQ
jgi:hypothetical protein